MTDPNAQAPASDFIRDRIRADLEAGRVQQVVTRFPPEPNGYLHIGHAKAITLSFSVAKEFGGRCNLRMDDTNPAAEDQEYVDAIKADVRWLGFEWDAIYYAADYFEQIYAWAEVLVQKGLAYVDDQTAEQIAATRGTLTQPGTPSPCRDRPSPDNLDLLRRMKAGEFADGEKVLRAKIDMAHPNLNMRDPVMYRIRHLHHQRTGDAWCIYPMYDWAHGQCDSIEGITHSLCTLEFEHHRPLYDWFCDNIGIYRPQQIEFARLNVEYMLTSKRKLLLLVEGGHVDGWDDPRLPTLRGLRRRGVPPQALVAFCKHVGVAKFNSTHEIGLFEYFVRDWLNKHAARRMAVLDPIKLVIDNWPRGADGQPIVEMVEAQNNPEDPTAGARQVPFSGELLIVRDDFMEAPPKDFFRLAPGREVRLRYGYFVTCTGVDKDAAGNLVAVRCSYDPATKGGNAPDGRKVKATIHWVSKVHAIDAEVHLLEHLFTAADPAGADGGDFLKLLNPNSRRVVRGKLEPSLGAAAAGDRFQFERLGYFCRDAADGQGGAPRFLRTVSLKDSWQKAQQKGGAPKGVGPASKPAGKKG
ncbi:MAG: glutamine--tRNA ligase/YqeY domain fusion protein [Planctomycetes bacterium]|nr:glutamine--tRNA ligase/YqeY domain fusion protein [Planctomycetota bacterium]